MPSHYENKLHDILNQADQSKQITTRIMLIEEAIRLADSHKDLDLGFLAREKLIEASVFNGYPHKALVAFSWCLALSDKDSYNYPEETLLWSYKWVTHSLAYFPQLSKTQIAALVEDLSKRFQRHGISLRPIYNIQCRLAWAQGEPNNAMEHRHQWQHATRDEYTNCIACEMDENVEFLLLENDTERALLQAEPILQGQVRCAEVPHQTYARILLPLLQQGRIAEAADYHLRGYGMLQKNRKFLRPLAAHLCFLALTDNVNIATTLLETHLPWALETQDFFDRLHFFLATRLFLQCLSKAHTQFCFRLPPTFPLSRSDHSYQLLPLQRWFEQQTEEIILTFNQRNGNPFFSQLSQEHEALLEHARPFPIEGSP